MGRVAKEEKSPTATPEDREAAYRLLAERAAWCLEADEEEAAMLLEAALAGPGPRVRIMEAMDGRAITVGLCGPTNRGKSTAWRALGEAVRERGGKPLVVIEIDRDSTPAQGSVRLPVSLPTIEIPESADLSDPEASEIAFRAGAKAAVSRCAHEVKIKTAQAKRLVQAGEGCGFVFESLSAFWGAYYDLVQSSYPEGHEDGYGRERGAAYNRAWAAAHTVFAAACSRDVARAVRGPVFGIIVCHMRPHFNRPAQSDPVFTEWGLDVGPSIGRKFRQAPDFLVTYGSDPKDGPDDPYPSKKRGYYAKLEASEHGASKARIADEEEQKAWEPLKSGEKDGLARSLLAVYNLRRRKAMQAIRESLAQKDKTP